MTLGPPCGKINKIYVLAMIGHIIPQTFKGMDVEGRVGCDEFMVYLRDIGSAENAEALKSCILRLTGLCIP